MGLQQSHTSTEYPGCLKFAFLPQPCHEVNDCTVSERMITPQSAADVRAYHIHVAVCARTDMKNMRVRDFR